MTFLSEGEEPSDNVHTPMKARWSSYDRRVCTHFRQSVVFLKSSPSRSIEQWLLKNMEGIPWLVCNTVHYYISSDSKNKFGLEWVTMVILHESLAITYQTCLELFISSVCGKQYRLETVKNVEWVLRNHKQTILEKCRWPDSRHFSLHLTQLEPIYRKLN